MKNLEQQKKFLNKVPIIRVQHRNIFVSVSKVSTVEQKKRT